MRLLPLLIATLFLAAGLHAQVTPGEILMAEMNCAACHSAGELSDRLDSRQSPRVGAEGVRATPQWLRAFLADPQHTQPGTLMPDLLHGRSAQEKAEAAEAITHFLVSLQSPAQDKETVASDAAIAEGERLYHTVGCVMCHAPQIVPPGKQKDGEVAEQLARLAQTSVPVGASLATKYTVAELSRFLRDPLRSRPSGRMPSLNLTEAEAVSIATYLLREQTAKDRSKVMRPVGDAPFTVDPAQVSRGKQFYTELNCAGCHAGAGSDVAAKPAKPLLSLVARQPRGCLSTKPGPKVPLFEITDRQRQVILALLQQPIPLKTPLDPEQQIRRTLATLNCYACHARDRRGGADPFRRDYYTILGTGDSSEDDRVPPTLTGVGARLSLEQFKQAMTGTSKVHPRMATRMPQFGEANTGQLAELFQKADHKP